MGNIVAWRWLYVGSTALKQHARNMVLAPCAKRTGTLWRWTMKSAEKSPNISAASSQQ